MAEDLETYRLLIPNHDVKNRLSLEKTRIRLQSVIASMEVRGSSLPAGQQAQERCVQAGQPHGEEANV